MAVNFFRQEYLRNPAAKLEELRSAGPVVRVRFPVTGKVWVTTTQQLPIAC
jgi:cytochrome P450 PksS